MSEKAFNHINLQEMVLEAVRALPGCGHVTAIELQHVRADGKGPNWKLLGTTPPLPPAALIDAHIAAERLADVYRMAE